MTKKRGEIASKVLKVLRVRLLVFSLCSGSWSVSASALTKLLYQKAFRSSVRQHFPFYFGWLWVHLLKLINNIEMENSRRIINTKMEGTKFVENELFRLPFHYYFILYVSMSISFLTFTSTLLQCLGLFFLQRYAQNYDNNERCL